VADVMARDPVTLGPEESLSTGLEVMRRHGIRRIPIVLDGVLVGLLAEGDLKRAQPSTLSASQEEFNRVMEGTTVSRIMIERPVTVAADVPLVEAARTLLETKYGALPVVVSGTLVGILTDTDLHRALVDLLEQGG
jgi:acetoin utilization protein AcuB